MDEAKLTAMREDVNTLQRELAELKSLLQHLRDLQTRLESQLSKNT